MNPTRARTRGTRCLALALACGGLSGCITTTARETVYTEGKIQVLLRGQKRGGEILDRGYAHPVVISEIRLINIISMLDIRVDAQRRPAVATELLDAVSRGVAKALAEAGPGQEVVVMAVEAQRRWGVFSHDFLTNFIVYARGNDLYFHFSRIDWEVPARRKDRLPEPHQGDEVMRFSMVADELITAAGSQAVSVPWRDRSFRRASRVRRNASGQLIRRTVLMEEPLLAPDVPQAPTVADVDSPEVLRALAELEDARRRGDISEPEYKARRAEILADAAGTEDPQTGSQDDSQKGAE